MQQATKQAQEECLSGLAIKNSDKNRCANRVANLKITHAEGTGDPCPRTLASVLERLDTWEEVHCTPKQGRTGDTNHDECGMAHNVNSQQDDNNTNQNCNQNRQRWHGSQTNGHEQNAGHGHGGLGRGAQGRGQGQDAARATPTNDQESHNVVDSSTFEDNDNDCSDALIDYCHSLTRAQRLTCDAFASLIIDSASSVDVVSNLELVHNIHKARTLLNVRTINGESTITQQACTGDHPPPVWLHPNGGVNTMSLNNMQKCHHCTMDTDVQNCVDVHLQNGSFCVSLHLATNSASAP